MGSSATHRPSSARAFKQNGFVYFSVVRLQLSVDFVSFKLEGERQRIMTRRKALPNILRILEDIHSQY